MSTCLELLQSRDHDPLLVIILYNSILCDLQYHGILLSQGWCRPAWPVTPAPPAGKIHGLARDERDIPSLQQNLRNILEQSYSVAFSSFLIFGTGISSRLPAICGWFMEFCADPIEMCIIKPSRLNGARNEWRSKSVLETGLVIDQCWMEWYWIIYPNHTQWKVRLFALTFSVLGIKHSSFHFVWLLFCTNLYTMWVVPS